MFHILLLKTDQRKNTKLKALSGSVYGQEVTKVNAIK